MKNISEKTVTDITNFFKQDAVEIHVFGSIARGTNDELSDIDIWITYEDTDIGKALETRMDSFSKFGEIILMHELQNNFPLNGIHTAIIYKIEGELLRVDFYLCPFSSSRMFPESKILFEKKKVEIGEMIPETKREKRDTADRITFLISMVFNGIKKVVRHDEKFIDFLIKHEEEIPELEDVPKELSFNTVRKAFEAFDTISNQAQKKAIGEMLKFLMKVESLSLQK